MKTNKKLLSISIILTILSLFWMIESYHEFVFKFIKFFNIGSEISKSLSLSFFSAFLVMALTSFVTYYNEKNEVFEEYTFLLARAYEEYKKTINRINLISVLESSTDGCEFRISLLDNLHNSLLECTSYTDNHFGEYRLEHLCEINK